MLTAGCATTQPVHENENDIVAFGMLKSRGYEALDDDGLDARITAELHISRVVAGSAPSRVLIIHYIAHSDLPEGRELRFHLRRADDGTYLVCTEGGRGYICR